MNVPVSDMAVCGGGGKSKFWQKMIADVYNLPIKTLSSEEGPALGVAILAGVSAGIFKNVAEGCKKMVAYKDVVDVSEKEHDEYMKYYDIYQKIYPETKEIFSELANI